MKKLRAWLATALVFVAAPVVGTIISALPNTLQNGQTADANQVMANFNQIVNNTNSNAAHNGANSDITSLSALSTPLSVPQGGTGAATLTAHGIVLGNGTSAPAFVAPGADGNLIVSAGAAADPVSAAATVGQGLTVSVVSHVPQYAFDVSFLRGHIGGLTLSRSSATVLGVSAGSAADSTAAVLIKLAAFTKSTAGTWAAGSGANGMGATLTIANSTWYHVCLIVNAAASDVYFDTDAGCTTHSPASTTARRRIGSFKTDGSAQILAFTQVGETFYWGASIVDVNEAASTSQTLKTMSAPLGVKTRLLAQATSIGSDGYMFGSPDQPNEAPSATAAPLDVNVSSPGTAFPVVYTNTSSQVWYRALSGGATLRIATLGWIDDRGRFD